MTSFNHYALGSVAGWMHSHILGLQVRVAGWKEFFVNPVPGGNLKWAEGGLASPYGKIWVTWRIRSVTRQDSGTKERFWIEVTAPPNTRAHVHLPTDTEVLTVVGSGVHTWEVEFVDDNVWPPEPIIAPNVPVTDGDLDYFDDALPCPWEDVVN